MTTTLPDISDYYDEGDNALHAEVDWLLASTGGWKRQLDWLLPKLLESEATSVVEFGPGTGLLGVALAVTMPEGFQYNGVEKSRKLLASCRKKDKPLMRFFEGDVRDSEWDADCACAFRFMKHFGLHEWDDVLKKVLSAGRFAAFDVQTLDHDLDDGMDWPHVHVTLDRIAKAVKAAGHEILETKTWHKAEKDGHGTLQDVAYWTRKVNG